MSALLDQFNKEYEYLYEHSGVAGYAEAVAWFDENQSQPDVAKLVEGLIDERHDFIASNREAAAFAFAVEALDLA